MDRTLAVAGWVAVAIAAAVLATQLIGSPFRIVAVAQALTPLGLPILVALAVVGALRRRPIFAFVTAAVGFGYLVVLAPLALHGSGPTPAAGARQVTIVSANVLFENDRVVEVGDALAALDVDVLALSEVTPDFADRLRRHPVADSYPHRIEAAAPLASGLALWSRLPLGPVGEHPSFDRSIDTTLLTGEGLIRVILLHPPPPVLRRGQWNAELAAVAGVVAQTAFPTVVVGDFNAGHFHPPFRDMIADAELRSALADDGRGFTPTWPTDRWYPPFTTLDHVLLDPDLATVTADVTTLPGSDHLAVVATFTFSD